MPRSNLAGHAPQGVASRAGPNWNGVGRHRVSLGGVRCCCSPADGLSFCLLLFIRLPVVKQLPAGVLVLRTRRTCAQSHCQIEALTYREVRDRQLSVAHDGGGQKYAACRSHEGQTFHRTFKRIRVQAQHRSACHTLSRHGTGQRAPAALHCQWLALTRCRIDQPTALFRFWILVENEDANRSTYP